MIYENRIKKKRKFSLKSASLKGDVLLPPLAMNVNISSNTKPQSDSRPGNRDRNRNRM